MGFRAQEAQRAQAHWLISLAQPSPAQTGCCRLEALRRRPPGRGLRGGGARRTTSVFLGTRGWTPRAAARTRVPSTQPAAPRGASGPGHLDNKAAPGGKSPESARTNPPRSGTAHRRSRSRLPLQLSLDFATAAAAFWRSSGQAAGLAWYMPQQRRLRLGGVSFGAAKCIAGNGQTLQASGSHWSTRSARPCDNVASSWQSVGSPTIIGMYSVVRGVCGSSSTKPPSVQTIQPLRPIRGARCFLCCV